MNRTHLRDAAARAFYRLARRVGVQMDFINPGDSTVTVWGLIDSSSQVTSLTKGGETDRSTVTFIVPRQTSFPPTAIKPGATIKYIASTGVEYGIDIIEPDDEEITQSSTFKFICSRFGDTAELD